MRIQLFDREYYRAEAQRFPAADRSELGRADMESATHLLYREFDLPLLPVFFSDRWHGTGYAQMARGGCVSWFDHALGGRDRTQPSHHISYGVNACRALTVAHEVGHYVRHEAWRRDQLLPWLRKPVGPYPKYGRVHDHRHAAVVARAVKILETAGFSRPSGVDAIRAAKERYLARIAGSLCGDPVVPPRWGPEGEKYRKLKEREEKDADTEE